MVFQSFNLFRHLTVLENLTLAPIKLRKQEKSEKHGMGLLAKVGKAASYPVLLSSGQPLPGPWQ